MVGHRNQGSNADMWWSKSHALTWLTGTSTLCAGSVDTRDAAHERVTTWLATAKDSWAAVQGTDERIACVDGSVWQVQRWLVEARTVQDSLAILGGTQHTSSLSQEKMGMPSL